MVRSGSLWVIGVAALAIGGGGWLLLSEAGGSGGGGDTAFEGHIVAEARHGPVLTGRESSRTVAPVETIDGEFTIPGKVVDEKGKPVADVPVAARRTGDAYPDRDPKRWSWDGGVRLTRAFEDLALATADAKPVATVKSAADGTFALVVRRRGDYALRAEPEAPNFGTSGAWYLNDKPPTSPLTLRVLPGSALRGRVVDAQDRGVEATVRASWSEEGSGWASSPVRTGDKGAFTFPAVPKGKVSLDVAVPGRMRLTGRIVTTPTDVEVVIRIGDGTPLLKGRVKDLQGQPVPGARVIVALNVVTEGLPPGEVVAVRYFASSNAEGEYAVIGPLGGPVSHVEAAAQGYLYTSATPPIAPWSGLELAEGREATLDIVLLKGGVLEGRVSEKGSGTALAGVEITVHPSALDARITRPPALSATSDAQGRYRIEGVPLGRNILLLRHPTHYLPALEALPRAGGDMVVQWDAVPPGPPPDLIVFVEQEGQKVVKDLELAKGVPFSGRVVDMAGAPVEGAEVLARGMGLGNMTWQWGLQQGAETKPIATSGAEGKFTVPGLPPRKDWVLYARKKPLLGEACPPFALSAEGPAPEILLKLTAGCTLVGRVVDDRGNPFAGAQVNAWAQVADFSEQQNETVRTGEDGTFRLEGLPAVSVHLNAWAQGRMGAGQQVAGLTAGEVRDGLELKLTSGVELSGTATDESGAPARFKSLMAMGIQGGNNTMTTTGADGSFKFTDVVAGQVRLSAGSWENNVELMVVQAPATGVRVTWKEPPQQVIEGTVVDAQGKAVPLCQVTIRQKTNQSPGMMHYSHGGDQGTTVINGWFRRNAPGKPPFVVEVSGPQDARGRPMNLRGKTLNDVDPKAGPLTITLEPGIELAGQVVDPGGKGVENVSVAVVNVRTTTDAQGGFTLGGLKEGEVQVVVMPPAPWVRPQPLPATAGTTDLVVRLRAGLAIAGQVRGENAKPLSNGWVNVNWKATAQSPEGNLGAQVGPDGRFRVEGVPEEAMANVQIQMWGMEGQKQYAPKNLPGIRPGTDDLIVDMAGGCEVDGIVVDAQGKPFTQGWVMVTTGPDDNQNSNWIQIQSDGTFRAAGLERGPVKLGVHRNDNGPVPEPVRVDAPASRVKLVLPVSTPLRGTLVGAGNVAWRLWAWTTGENRRTVRASVGTDGKFSIEGASPGSQWMVAARARNNDDDRYALGGPFAAGAENITLELRVGRSIEGTVTCADGSDISSGTWARAASDTWNTTAQANAKGEFRIRGLPPGRYKLTAGSSNDQTASQDDVDDGASGLRLTLRPSTE